MTMSVAETRELMAAYGQALLGHADYARYFSDDVTLTVMNGGQETRGREAVAREIDAQHQRASEVRLRNMIVGEGQAAAEAEFVGADRAVVPYAVAYDLADGKIAALRLYFAGSATS